VFIYIYICISFTGSPRPKWGQQYTNETQVGDYATLWMEVNSYPRPEYTWVKADGNPVRGFITSDDTFTRVEFLDVQIR